MTTFERYFIADKATHQEPKNPYYRLLEEEEVVNRILSEFGLEGAEAHIINGHIPVEAKRGESPVKCGGKLLIIDGGFSKAYQPKTGIAGYTLIYNSYGLVLAAHEPFESVEKAVQDGSDIASHTILVQHVVRRQGWWRIRTLEGSCALRSVIWRRCCRHTGTASWWRRFK